MHRLRALASCTFLFLASSLLGCHPPAPPSADDGAPLNQEAVDQRVNGMKMVGSGTNTPIKYKATQFGRLYLYDETTGLPVYTGSVATGETFLFAPASSRAEINKQTIDLMRDTNEKDEYRLYFIPQ